MGDDGRVYACSACPEGKAAVKMLEFEDFEEFPQIMKKKCTVIDTSVASDNDCDRFYGWRIDNLKIDSVSILDRLKYLGYWNRSRNKIEYRSLSLRF